MKLVHATSCHCNAATYKAYVVPWAILMSTVCYIYLLNIVGTVLGQAGHTRESLHFLFLSIGTGYVNVIQASAFKVDASLLACLAATACSYNSIYKSKHGSMWICEWAATAALLCMFIKHLLRDARKHNRKCYRDICNTDALTCWSLRTLSKVMPRSNCFHEARACNLVLL